MPSDLHTPRLEIRDPVHGFIRLSKVEMEIVNTRTFQRLRDVRQLAMGHMVYPGAVHNRFEHSLGCVELSTRMFDALRAKQGKEGCPSFSDAFFVADDGVDRGRQVLRLASLLHDIGHPPFSHSGEELLPDDLSHEDMTRKLITETEIEGIIRRRYGSSGISPELVAQVATKTESPADGADSEAAWNQFLCLMLTGELGSDRMDYLLRDAHHSGQPTGIFDVAKLMESMTIVEPPKEATTSFELGLHMDGTLVAEQMIAARYLMYTTLYFHKTKRIYEHHLETFTKAWLARQFGKPQLPSDPTNYIALTDSAVLAAMADALARREQSELAVAAAPLDARCHWRMAFELVPSDIPKQGGSRPIRPDLVALDKFTQSVYNVLGVDKVWIDVLDHSAAKFLRAERPESIKVRKSGQTRELAELSEIVTGMQTSIWRARVYAPKEDRERVKMECERLLNEARRVTEDGGQA